MGLMCLSRDHGQAAGTVMPLSSLRISVLEAARGEGGVGVDSLCRFNILELKIFCVSLGENSNSFPKSLLKSRSWAPLPGFPSHPYPGSPYLLQTVGCVNAKTLKLFKPPPHSDAALFFFFFFF